MNSGPPFDERGTKRAKATTMQFPERPGWLQDVNSMLVSATCHLSRADRAGAAHRGGHRRRAGRYARHELGGNGGDSGDRGDGPIADGSALEDTSTAAISSRRISQPRLARRTKWRVSAPLTTDFAPPDVASGRYPPSLAALRGTSLDGARKEQVAAAGQLLGGTGGKGRGGGGNGDGSSTKASTEFFGIGGYGQTFVYVVDASDSMNDSRQVRAGPLRAAAIDRTAWQRPAVLRHLLQRRGVPDGCR